MTAGPRRRHLPEVPRTPEGRVDLDGILAAVVASGEPPLLLESVPGTPGTGRWSYVVAATSGRLTWTAEGELETTGRLAHLDAADPFTALDQACDALGLSPHTRRDPASPPFMGGLVGGLGYDLARAIETVPARAQDDRRLPVLDLWAAEAVVAVDHEDEEASVIARPDVDLDRLVRVLAGAPPAPAARTAVPPQRAGAPARTSLPRDAYVAAVAAVLEHIAAGDTFQVNLSQRLTARWDGGVHDLYRALRAASPAPYGAVVPCGEAAVASISPETFLHVASGRASVRPIKGTRARDVDPERDAELRDELASSEKDRAENIMVVDMERNDLGRVCVPGTVEVPTLCAVEAHPTVWHLVSTVTGQLRADAGYADLLRATFPCGSVTGTPKVRAMSLIERYEPVRRGWYCGALGFLADGAASLSVAIRTSTLLPDGRVDYGAGGGIVADSDPAAEHDESLAKAAAFLRAVGTGAPAPH